MITDDTEAATTHEEESGKKKNKRSGAKKAKAVKKTAKAAAKGKKKKAANGASRPQRLNEERKDVYAALLRVHADTPRSNIIEGMASDKNSGKTFTAEQISKWKGVEWDDLRMIQSFCSQRIPAKLGKYPDAAKRIKHLAPGDGTYGLEVR